MKFLIAGLGSIGRRHLRNLIALGEEDIVLLRTGKSTLPNGELEAFPTEYSLDDALAHGPDAVIISNPTALHLEVAIPAARAGCHLLVEKPISHSMEGIEGLEDALRAGGGKVLMGFQFRYHPSLIAIKRWLDDGNIGKVITASAWWGEYLPDWHPWEDFHETYAARADLGGGVVSTLCHPFDYLHWYFGNARAVLARSDKRGEWNIPVEDNADVLIEFSDHVRGVVHLDYIQRPPEHTLKIVGTDGTITWEASDGVARCFESSQVTWKENAPPADFERNSMFLDESAHFIDIVRDDVEPNCSLEDGLFVQRVIEAVKQSSVRDQVVAL